MQAQSSYSHNSVYFKTVFTLTPVRHDAVCVNNIIMVQHAVRVNSVIYKTSRCLFLVSASSRLVMSCNENMTTNDRNPCTFNFRHFPVLHFPAMHFCPLFSGLAFSTPPRYFIVRHFPVLHFQRPLRTIL